MRSSWAKPPLERRMGRPQARKDAGAVCPRRDGSGARAARAAGRGRAPALPLSRRRGRHAGRGSRSAAPPRGRRRARGGARQPRGRAPGSASSTSQEIATSPMALRSGGPWRSRQPSRIPGSSSTTAAHHRHHPRVTVGDVRQLVRQHALQLSVGAAAEKPAGDVDRGRPPRHRGRPAQRRVVRLAHEPRTAHAGQRGQPREQLARTEPVARRDRPRARTRRAPARRPRPRGRPPRTAPRPRASRHCTAAASQPTTATRTAADAPAASNAAAIRACSARSGGNEVAPAPHDGDPPHSFASRPNSSPSAPAAATIRPARRVPPDEELEPGAARPDQLNDHHVFRPGLIRSILARWPGRAIGHRPLSLAARGTYLSRGLRLRAGPAVPTPTAAMTASLIAIFVACAGATDRLGNAGGH